MCNFLASYSLLRGPDTVSSEFWYNIYGQNMVGWQLEIHSKHFGEVSHSLNILSSKIIVNPRSQERGESETKR